MIRPVRHRSLNRPPLKSWPSWVEAQYFDTDPDRFYNEIGAVLDETIYWRGIAKGLMGDYASNARYRSLDDSGRKALREQLESFTDIMKSGLIRTYAKGLLAFSGSKFEIVDDETIDPDARSASITQLVYGSVTALYREIPDGQKLRRQLATSQSYCRGYQFSQIYQNQFAQPRSLLMAMSPRLWRRISRPTCRRI